MWVVRGDNPACLLLKTPTASRQLSASAQLPDTPASAAPPLPRNSPDDAGGGYELPHAPPDTG